MGLDIGIISIKYLERPKGIVYDFALHMAAEAGDNAYMFGEGNSWIPFTQRQTLGLLDDFARERSLSQAQRSEIQTWLGALPWLGNFEAPGQENDEDDNTPVIELHFNW